MSLRQQNKERSRASILEAALALIAEHGVAQTSTRDIAKRASVSYQTLYNYFPTKGHIVQSLVAADLDAWSVAVDAAIKQYSGDLLATLALMNRVSLQHFSGEQLAPWREIVPQLLAQDSAQQFTSLNQVTHERYHALLSMAQGMRQLDADVDLHLLAHTLYCLVDHALLHQCLSDQNAETFLQTLQEQLALLVTPYLV